MNILYFCVSLTKLGFLLLGFTGGASWSIRRGRYTTFIFPRSMPSVFWFCFCSYKTRNTAPARSQATRETRNLMHGNEIKCFPTAFKEEPIICELKAPCLGTARPWALMIPTTAPSTQQHRGPHSSCPFSGLCARVGTQDLVLGSPRSLCPGHPPLGLPPDGVCASPPVSASRGLAGALSALAVT